MPTFEPWSIVVVPFPFTDSTTKIKRPALVISSEDFNRTSGHVLLLMITSTKRTAWPMDIAISDLLPTGLTVDSLIRMKAFTLDTRFVIKSIGSLGPIDRETCRERLTTLFNHVLKSES